MRRYLKVVLSLSLSLLLLAGCGEGSGGPQGGSGGSGAQGSETSGRSLWVEQTFTLTVEEPDTDYSDKLVYSGVYGGALYLLAIYRYEEESGPDMWLYTFRMDTQETEKTPFVLEIPDMEDLYIDSMTVTGEGEITFRIYGTREGRSPSSFLCRTDLTGKPLDEDHPLSEDTGYPPESGRFCAGPDGFSLYTQAGDRNTDVLRCNVQDRSTTVLTSLEGFVNALCPDGQGGLYYILNGADLWYRDPGGQRVEKLLSLSASGINLTVDIHILMDGEDKLAVCCVSNEGSTVYLLTDEEVSGQLASAEYDTLRITSLSLYYYYDILKLAQDWSVGTGLHRVLIEKEEDAQELDALRTRTLADITTGQGPEILLVSEDDMRMLADKGAILDLAEVVPEEIQEQFLPCVRELGTVDGTWVGLPSSMLTIYTLCTSDALWSEDNWTVTDVLDIADTRDDWDWVVGFHDQYGRDIPQNKPDSRLVFDRLFRDCLGDSQFLDVDRGISYFKGEEFIRALEFCKRYGQNPNQKSSEEVDKMLQDGNLIAMDVYFYGGLKDYSEMMASASGCHTVGFPDEEGNGNYMNVESYLVVNANAADLDAVRDCISFLFSYDSEFYKSNPIRMDVLRDQVVLESPLGRPATKIKIDDFSDGFAYIPLDVKPDGSTYLEEYCAFLDNCEPKPYCPQAIMDIVGEEIDMFFAGSRSAKETAEVIHRRVQLYFDEQ